KANDRIAPFVQTARHVGMAIAKNKLNAPLDHQVLAGTRVVGQRLHRTMLEVRFERAQPAREERNRKRVRDREAKARGRLVLREARFDSGRLEASERIPHKRQEGAAGAVWLAGGGTPGDRGKI